MEKGKLGPQPSERHLLKDVAAGTGGDEADSGPMQPSPSHAPRVSFSSRLQVRHTPSPAPPDRGDRSSRHPRLQQGAGSQPSSGRPQRGPGPRSGVCSPGPLPPPANAAARGQCRRLRSCAACSGRASLDTSLALPSAPHTPASTEPAPVLIDRFTQTEPPTPARCGAGESVDRVDRGTQTESPVRERCDPCVPALMDQGTQTELAVLLPSTAPAAPRAPEPPGRRQRFSLFHRLLRACRGSFSRAQPEQLGSKRPQPPPRAPPPFAPGIGVLMVLQEPAEGAEWYPFSWPWLVETSL